MSSIFDDPKKTIENEKITTQILKEAQELGLVDDRGDELLLESKAIGRNVAAVKQTRDAKMNTLFERACLITSQERRDDLFNEWNEARILAEEARKKIVKKYGNSTRNRIKETIRNARAIIRGTDK